MLLQKVIISNNSCNFNFNNIFLNKIHILLKLKEEKMNLVVH